MNDSIYEIIVYEVTDRERATAARRKAMASIETYPGFRAYRNLDGLDSEKLIAVLIEWDSHESVKAAGKKIESDPAAEDIFGCISEVKLIASFTSEKLASSAMANVLY